MKSSDLLKRGAGDCTRHETHGSAVSKRSVRRGDAKPKKHSFKHARAFLMLACAALLAALLFMPPTSAPVVRVAKAASPASGTIAATGPVIPFTGTWTGTASATGAAQGESTCVEGTNCDTFRLTVAPGDYTGKQISVKLQWTIPA